MATVTATIQGTPVVRQITVTLEDTSIGSFKSGELRENVLLGKVKNIGNVDVTVEFPANAITNEQNLTVVDYGMYAAGKFKTLVIPPNTERNIVADVQLDDIGNTPGTPDTTASFDIAKPVIQSGQGS